MIAEIEVQNFKRLKSETFRFKPSGVSLLAGDNNSGKTTVLHAVALWAFLVEKFRASFGEASLRSGHGSDVLSTTPTDFTPLAVPDLRYLWTNLQSGRRLLLRARWNLAGNPPAPTKTLAFSLKHVAGNLETKVFSTNLGAADTIPRGVYLPAFAGIRVEERELPDSERGRLIGEGLAGAVLRNVLADMEAAHTTGLAGLHGVARSTFRRNSPWEQLQEVLEKVFSVGLKVSRLPVQGGGTRIVVDLQKVRIMNKQRRFDRTPPQREIMVEGSGFLQWLSVYALAVNRELHVLLLDEPDAHLHKQLQDELLFRLKNLLGQRAQALVATHSMEVLGDADLGSVYWLETMVNGSLTHSYLQDEEHRRRLFLGLGGIYAPKIQKLRKHKRLLMLEGPGDIEMLRVISPKLRGPLPDDLVVWFYKESEFDKSKYSRKVLFKELAAEIAGLKGLSLEDRDDKIHWKDVQANLAPQGTDKGRFAMRMWRRRNFENYLLVPDAIARATGKTKAEIDEFLLQKHGFAVAGSFQAHACHPSLCLLDGKQILTAHPDSVQNTYGVSAMKVAEELLPAEIADDVKAFVNDLHDVWATL